MVTPCSVKLEDANCVLQFIYPSGWNLFTSSVSPSFSFMRYASVELNPAMAQIGAKVFLTNCKHWWLQKNVT